MTDTTETAATDFFDASIRTPEMEMSEIGAGVPAAAGLEISEINPANPHLFKEDRWQDHFARLRAEDPVHLNEIETAGRYWSITKYADVRAVDGDWETYSSAKGITLGLKEIANSEEMEQPGIQTFIAMDPPKHDVQRKTVSPVVAPSNLANMEPLIRERTIEVLDSLPIGETFDWVDTVSIELTTRMLATLFDFPFEDRRKLTRWSDVSTAVPGRGIIDTEQQRIDELMECLTYFTNLWNEKRVNPGDDLVSLLANGEETKDMQPMEFLGNLILLIVGGNDTTRNSMTGSVLALNEFPSEYEKLRNDLTLIPNMVAELIRWQTPLAYMRRTANFDCEIRDKKIKAGDQILMWYVSGNRDESVFENPNDLIIDRANARSHLSFGFGLHRCFGNRLAEQQLRILWEEIMKRFHKIEVMEEPKRTPSSFVKGYTYMPVKLHAK